ncbi:hypothetical protein QQF64_004584 [Cirrhinus molitorella]|uniref:Uncharacterized protein n=2 Tax=Cirrhinus molitorella TaxID=172907 RepID=A0ABR3MGN2_9TELE|nr:hypothetical protein Q8A67_020711 [Cirrhinus molitorella]
MLSTFVNSGVVPRKHLKLGQLPSSQFCNCKLLHWWKSQDVDVHPAPTQLNECAEEFQTSGPVHAIAEELNGESLDRVCGCFVKCGVTDRASHLQKEFHDQ